MDHSGRARLGRKTKELVKCLQPREIPIIDHADLDALGAQQLVDCGVRVVLNAADSITGRYPNLGPQLLSECGVSIIDCLGERVFELVQNGDYLRISGDKIYRGGELVARGRMLTPELIEQMMEQARKNLDLEVSKFVDNTIAHVQKEKDLILDRMIIPKIRPNFSTSMW